jgi:hypothetical protein
VKPRITLLLVLVLSLCGCIPVLMGVGAGLTAYGAVGLGQPGYVAPAVAPVMPPQYYQNQATIRAYDSSAMSHGMGQTLPKQCTSTTMGGVTQTQCY